jgi:2-deoxy-D-gluconate 3-dehydrogenase
MYLGQGTGGLGLEMCLAMSECGANIVSIHLPNDPAQRKMEEAIAAVGGKVAAFASDVGNSVELRKTFHSIWEAGIVPDVLLNCAGLNRRGAIEEMTDDNIDLVIIPRSTVHLLLMLASRSFRSI